MRRRHAVVLSVLVFALLSVVGSPPTTVSAHASFLGSDPANGSVLEVAPETVRLDFDEAVLAPASRVSLIELGAAGEVDLQISATDDDRTIIATLPALERGAYVLRFDVTDPADLHRTVGSVSFGIGVEAPPSEAPRQIAGSFLSIGGGTVASILLVAVVGASLLLQFGAGEALGRAGRRRVARWAAVAAGALSALWLVLLLDEAAGIGWSNISLFSLLISSDPGRRFIIGVQLWAGIWWASRLLSRADRRAGEVLVERVIGVIALGFVTIAAFAGHTGIGGNRWVGIAIRFVHLSAICAWVGAVGVAAVAVRRQLVDDVPRLWRAVSRTAAFGLAGVGVSGLLLSGRLVETVTALLSTTYGLTIVAKIVGLAVLAVLGLRAARRVAGARLVGDRFLGTEMAVAAIVLVLAAVLAATPPARGEQFLPLDPPQPQVVTADVADLVVSASLLPARPGPNLLEVRVLDTRRPAPGPIDGVTITIADGAGVEVLRLDGVPRDGVMSWQDVSLPAPGAYTLNARIARDELVPPPFDATFAVAPAPAPRVDTVVSDRRLAGLVVPIAVMWAVVVAVAAVTIRRRSNAARAG